MQLKDGSTLQNGKYRIIRVLGQGGFGITYLAKNTFFDRLVAIKEFFPKDFCGRDNTSHLTLGTQNNAETVSRLKDRFLKEAKNIAKLDHPGIVKIHDIFEENNTAYYVMDYIEGENLNEMVKREGPLPENKAIEYIRKVGDALDYIHSRNMTHFDVKPANIMVRKSDDQPVLIDFGLSKQYDIHGDATSTLMQGVSQGYSPIELYNAGVVTSFSPETDVYSLAATLLYLLTGKVPSSAAQIIDEGLDIPHSISGSNKSAIEAAMMTSRSKRIKSISTFINNLNYRGINSSVSKACEEVASNDNGDATILIDHGNNAYENNHKEEIYVSNIKGNKDKIRYYKYAIITILVLILGCAILKIANNDSDLSTIGHNLRTPDNSVSNTDNILTADQVAELDKLNKTIGNELGLSIISLIIQNSGVNDFKTEFADSIFNVWGIGDSKLNNGILFAIDKENREIAIVIGSGIESDYTDEHCRTIIKQMVPYCQNDDYFNAFRVGVENLKHKPIDQLLNLTENQKKLLLDSIDISTDQIVDLGLSVYWAGYNIGAKKPEQYGNLYRYGDPYNKLYLNEDYLPDENIIESNNDVAHVIWGESWRTPSKEEAQELIEKCLFKDTTYKGINGAKIVGPSMQAIFMPYPGTMYNYGRSQAGSVGIYQLGECWKEINQYTKEPWAQSYELSLFVNTFDPEVIDYGTPSWGSPVRAVMNKPDK